MAAWNWYWHALHVEISAHAVGESEKRPLSNDTAASAPSCGAARNRVRSRDRIVKHSERCGLWACHHLLYYYFLPRARFVTWPDGMNLFLKLWNALLYLAS